MRLTPETAKTKWCPFARVPRQREGGSMNRNVLDPSFWPHCIADECMAWCWYNQPADKAKQIGFCGLIERGDQ